MLLVCFALILKNASSQSDGVSISPGNNAAHDAAMLDVQSTDKGVLITRMTESQMQSINPTVGADGLQVFVTDDPHRGLWFFDESLNNGVGKWVRYGIDIDKLMPQEVIMPFNLSACPDGWVEFTDGEGRLLVGLGQDPTDNSITYTKGNVGGQAKVALQLSETPNHQHNFTGTITGGHTNSHSHSHNLFTRNSGTSVDQHRDAEYGRKKKRKLSTGTNGDKNTQLSDPHRHTVSGTVTGTLSNNPADLQGLSHENRPPYITVIYCIRNF